MRLSPMEYACGITLPNFKVFAVDLSRQVVDRAAEFMQFLRLEDRVSLLCARLPSLQPTEKSFDFVFTLHGPGVEGGLQPRAAPASARNRKTQICSRSVNFLSPYLIDDIDSRVERAYRKHEGLTQQWS